MNTIKNHKLIVPEGNPVTLDVYWLADNKPKPIVVFAHGFKGFKDWGHWHLIAESFAKAGFCFVKFNFSNNGVTPDDLFNFADLEAFGNNNYTKELNDIQLVIDWIIQDKDFKQKINWQEQNISLIGHSRGGPIVLIAGLENKNVKAVITWASVNELNYAWGKTNHQILDWEKEGVYYIRNGRTKQNMPMYYQIYDDYLQNKLRFSTIETLRNLKIPYLILHGAADPAVPVATAQYLFEHANDAQLHIIENANHVFGGMHPFVGSELPEHSKELVARSLLFLEEKTF
ncbi:MAG: alpha/beta fold hydrolase [Saprospiraceae bacterium]|nr:alpha/beta fold hydrolase [Saprospiraceae bacterium]